MCEDCGCGVTESTDQIAVEVLHKLNAQNDHYAQHNREHLAKHGVFTVNLMSSPGSGKTQLLEALSQLLMNHGVRIAVIEGDLETENDAERLRQLGVQAIQINTSTACHLDARQIHQALHQLPLSDIDILFIENVGNLVCPATFDLGQHKNIVLLASTEGDDKPSKYPVMFRAADAVLVSKSDLLSVLDDFSLEKAKENFRKLANQSPIFEVSGKMGQGVNELINLLNAWRQKVSVE